MTTDGRPLREQGRREAAREEKQGVAKSPCLHDYSWDDNGGCSSSGPHILPSWAHMAQPYRA